MACNILKDLEGIALPMYFFGSGTCCSLGGRFAWVSSGKFPRILSTLKIVHFKAKEDSREFNCCLLTESL